MYSFLLSFCFPYFFFFWRNAPSDTGLFLCDCSMGFNHARLILHCKPLYFTFQPCCRLSPSGDTKAAVCGFREKKTCRFRTRQKPLSRLPLCAAFSTCSSERLSEGGGEKRDEGGMRMEDEAPSHAPTIQTPCATLMS